MVINARETEDALVTETRARMAAEERALSEARARIEAEMALLEKDTQIHALKKRLHELENQPNPEGIPMTDD